MSTLFKPRLTLTKAWYGFSDADAEVVIRAFEEPETVTPADHINLEQKPAQISPLIDRVLLLAVVADLLAETIRTVEKLSARVEQIEKQLARFETQHPTSAAQEVVDDDAYNDGTIGPRVLEPEGPAV